MNESVPNFPFSFEFFAQCFSNGYNRKDHQTLDNSDKPKLFAIQLMFMAMNKHAAFNQAMLNKDNISSFLRLPLTNENIKVPEEFKTTLLEVLR